MHFGLAQYQAACSPIWRKICYSHERENRNEVKMVARGIAEQRSFVYPEWVEENEIRGYGPHVVYAVTGEEDSKSNQPRRATAMLRIKFD